MPELAEVYFYHRQWDMGLGQPVRGVRLHKKKRIFREGGAEAIEQHLPGRVYEERYTHGKQMLFRFSGGAWLGLHLGMAGKLTTAFPEIVPAAAEHLVLIMDDIALVFSDFRQFGRVRFELGETLPQWWQELPPEILGAGFTVERVGDYLKRRRRAPIKSVLLMQDVFPGIGNWMADEILWRAKIDPRCPAGSITPRILKRLYEAIRAVARDSIKTVGITYEDPPEDWLFRHRWRDGGTCPRTGVSLKRETIGGRTTCYSPKWQTFGKRKIQE